MMQENTKKRHLNMVFITDITFWQTKMNGGDRSVDSEIGFDNHHKPFLFELHSPNGRNHPLHCTTLSLVLHWITHK